MSKIWANRLIAGTKVWADVPERRRAAVDAELKLRAAAGELTEAEYAAIVGRGEVVPNE